MKFLFITEGQDLLGFLFSGSVSASDGKGRIFPLCPMCMKSVLSDAQSSLSGNFLRFHFDVAAALMALISL